MCLHALTWLDVGNAASPRYTVTSGQLPKPSDSYQKLQLTLNENGASLNASASHLVVSSKGGSSMLAKAAKKFTDDAMLVFDAALAIAGATKVKHMLFTTIIMEAMFSRRFNNIVNHSIEPSYWFAL